MALGELGLSIDYFYSLTPRQFSNTMNGYRKKEDNLSKERWMMTRKIMYFSIVLKTKNLKEKDILSFPWEEDIQAEFNEEQQQMLLDEIDQVKAYYDERDRKKAAAIV